MEMGRSQDLRLALGQVTVLESGPGASQSTEVWPLGMSQYLILAMGKVTVLESGPWTDTSIGDWPWVR